MFVGSFPLSFSLVERRAENEKSSTIKSHELQFSKLHGGSIFGM